MTSPRTSVERMPDWTIIATTLGASGITGALGYSTARLQAGVAKAQVEAETERLGTQHAEDHLRNRQTTYHLLLDELRAFSVVMWNGPTPTPEEFKGFLSRSAHLLNGARLFGTDNVRVAAEQVDTLIGAIELHTVVASLDFNEALEEAVESSGKKLDTAIRALVDAMRADVAPDRTASG